MKKKIAADLTSLAHRILQMKNKEDVEQMQAIAKELYEKLTVLVFTEKHFADVKPTAGEKEVQEKMNQAFEEAQEDVKTVADDVETVMEKAQDDAMNTFTRNDLSDLFVPKGDHREPMDLPGISTIQKMVTEMPDKAPETPQPPDRLYHDIRKAKDQELEKERKSFTTNSLTDLVVPEDGNDNDMDLPGINTIQKMVFEMPDDEVTAPENPMSKKKDLNDMSKKTPAKEDTVEDLEQLTQDFQSMPVFERKSSSSDVDRPQSLNSRLHRGLKIGMNDRLGFVKHLFNGSDQDFNRVISQLNTMNSYDQAHEFIMTMIKPDYNHWTGKESFETRFLDIVERSYQ